MQDIQTLANLNNYLVLDVETTMFKNKNANPPKDGDANPFSEENFLVLGGAKHVNNSNIANYFWSEKDCEHISPIFSTKPLIVGFNLKFDLHWIRRYGITDFQECLVWDCQLAEFLLSNQSWVYPDLATASGGEKLDFIKNNYWDKGIDTDQIPIEELRTYLRGDLEATEKLFLKQKEILEQDPTRFNLFKLQCADLLMLEEMEWNGFILDRELLSSKEEEVKEELKGLETELKKHTSGVGINLSSNDQLSIWLYGGEYIEEIRVPTRCKNGNIRNKIEKRIHKFPGIFKPLPKTELEKKGVFSTAEPILRQLKDKNGILKTLLRLKELQKLLNTYFIGIPKKLELTNPIDGKIHGTLNQCVAITGRLSATKPNQQNMDPRFKECLITEYEH